jgi:hypothetical protein
MPNHCVWRLQGTRFNQSTLAASCFGVITVVTVVAVFTSAAGARRNPTVVVACNTVPDRAALVGTRCGVRHVVVERWVGAVYTRAVRKPFAGPTLVAVRAGEPVSALARMLALACVGAHAVILAGINRGTIVPVCAICRAVLNR